MQQTLSSFSLHLVALHKRERQILKNCHKKSLQNKIGNISWRFSKLCVHISLNFVLVSWLKKDYNYAFFIKSIILGKDKKCNKYWNLHTLKIIYKFCHLDQIKSQYNNSFPSIFFSISRIINYSRFCVTMIYVILYINITARCLCHVRIQ